MPDPKAVAEENLGHIPMADEDPREDFAAPPPGAAAGSAGSAVAPGREMDGEDLLSADCSLDPTLGHTSSPPPPLPALLDPDMSPEEQEEKARLIAQVLELQNTLDDLSSRVDNVKEENLRLRSENQVLGQYIENLMAASSVFQPANEQPQRSSRRK